MPDAVPSSIRSLPTSMLPVGNRIQLRGTADGKARREGGRGGHVDCAYSKGDQVVDLDFARGGLCCTCRETGSRIGAVRRTVGYGWWPE